MKKCKSYTIYQMLGDFWYRRDKQLEEYSQSSSKRMSFHEIMRNRPKWKPSRADKVAARLIQLGSEAYLRNGKKFRNFQKIPD